MTSSNHGNGEEKSFSGSGNLLHKGPEASECRDPSGNEDYISVIGYECVEKDGRTSRSWYFSLQAMRSTAMTCISGK